MVSKEAAPPDWRSLKIIGHMTDNFSAHWLRCFQYAIILHTMLNLTNLDPPNNKLHDRTYTTVVVYYYLVIDFIFFQKRHQALPSTLQLHNYGKTCKKDSFTELISSSKQISMILVHTMGTCCTLKNLKWCFQLEKRTPQVCGE